MKLLGVFITVFLGFNAKANDTFISNVSLKVDGGEVSSKVQCFVDESMRLIFTDYELSKVTYSTIDKVGLPEDENTYASVHFLAKQKVTGKIQQFFITLTSFDEQNKWTYVQGETSIYPFSKKVSDLATTGIKQSGKAPSYLILDTCK